MFNPMYPGMYQPNLQSYPPTSTSTVYQPRMEVTRVSGENGARAFQMPPNSSVLLLDDTAPIIWLKTTDGASYPTLKPFSITPYVPEEPIDMKSLEDRVKRLEETLNAKSDVTSSKHKQISSVNEQHSKND